MRLSCLMIMLVILCFAVTLQASEARSNVLLIIVDDLRPEFPAYGAKHIHAPNLERFAREGVVFERAYCQSAVCGPSRASMLTGLRPAGKRFLQWNCKASVDAPDALTMPALFKQHGYRSLAFGKVFHSRKDRMEDWSAEPFKLKNTCKGWRHYLNADNQALQNAGANGMAWEVSDAPEHEFQDAKIATAAIASMTQAQSDKQPFFIACGFVRPHLPFIVPRADWDRYPAEQITLPKEGGLPQGVSAKAGHPWHELRAYKDIPKKGPVSHEQAIALTRGYYASVTHMDRQLGRVLDALDAHGLSENTHVVVVGDHGWLLQDHGLWCKHCNFHKATQVPLIIRSPGQAPARCARLVEMIDIYPTVLDLAALDKPDHLEGDSMLPLLKNPQRPWKEAVFTRFYGQESVITEQFNYTTIKGAEPMCFDLTVDEQETQNIAQDPEHEQAMQRLQEIKGLGWQAQRTRIQEQ